MARTIRDYAVNGGALPDIRDRISKWLSSNGFRIVDPSSSGQVTAYEAPEAAHRSGRTGAVGGARFQLASVAGSIVALNAAYAPGARLSVVFYAVCPRPAPGGVAVHAECFFATPVQREVLGWSPELEMTDTIWAPAGIARKKAWPLFQAFEKFMTSLPGSTSPSPG